MTGGLIYPQNWLFKVVKLPTSGELAGAIEIRGLKYIGNEGEGLIGEPYNFNSYPDVINLLKDPNRQSIYIPPSPAPNQEYSSQQETTVPFQTQRVPAPQKALSAHQPKRRKGSKDHPEWNNVKSVAYKGYQVTAGQIGMLDNDASWVTPETIQKKDARPTQEEEEILPTPQPLVGNGEGHPPLGSPGSPSHAVEEQSQFETQAPPLLAESELREEQARLESQTDAKEEEEEEEEALSWSASPPPEQKNTEPPSSSPLWPPAIETGNDDTDHPPLDSEEEPEPEEVGEGNQEDGEEVEHEETEVLFEEDKVKEDMEMDVDVPPSTLVVSTAEIMTQNADPKTEEIVENITEDVDAGQDEGEKMDIEEQEAVLQGDNSEEQRQTVEEVEQTIFGSSEKKEEPLSTGEVIRDSASQSLSKDPQATTNLHSQPISTTQDDSFTSQYPTSSSANQPTSTQHPSDDSQQHLPFQQPSSNARASETPVFHPPTDIASRHTSPPKATPVPPQIPASAQVQVTETPLQAQKPQQPLVPSSVTHITSTLPVNQSSPLKQPIDESRRKHKRDRHVGPIIPRFSRKEKKMKIDLQALLFEDHRKFMGIRAERPSQREDEDVEMKDVIEEVIQEVVDETAEELVEKEVNEDAEEPMEEEQHQEEVRAIAKEGEREAIEIVDQDEDDKIVEEIVEERITKTIQEPPAAGEPMVTQAEVVETQESSQTFDVSASRWGRFISHWKRFS